jgi:hypothetical protein
VNLTTRERIAYHRMMSASTRVSQRNPSRSVRHYNPRFVAQKQVHCSSQEQARATIYEMGRRMSSLTRSEKYPEIVR